MFVNFLVYTVFLISLALGTLTSDNQTLSKIFFSIVMVILCYHIYYEFRQAKQGGLDYITDFWNMIDVMRIILVIASVIFTFFIEIDKEPLLNLYSWASLICWAKALQYLSVFEKTRHLLMMISQVMMDLIPFACILLIISFGFAHIFTLQLMVKADDGSSQMKKGLMNAYVLMFGELGGFDEFSSNQWAFFSISSCFIIIVLLNLLIAIISDTFEKVQENSESYGNM
jgi:hypothetical protein